MSSVKFFRSASRFVLTAAIVLSAVVLLIFAGCAKEEGFDESGLSETLTILNWEDYIDKDVVNEFEERYNINVVFVCYENENEMLSLVQSNPGNYDLAVASGSVVEMMKKLKLVEEIDKDNIPNLSKVGADFRNPPFDRYLECSVPYLWGTTGVAVNRKYVKDEKIGWDILFDGRFRGKIDMLDDIQENFSPPLKMLGASINTTDEETLKKCEKILKEQKGIIRGYFDSIEIQEHLEEGSTYVAYLYSGDTYAAMEENEDLEYIVPEEGAPIWIDNWIIPANAKNKGTAEFFINYIIEPENIARISNYVWYANAVPESKEFINDELLSSEDIYLSDDLIKRCEYYTPLDDDVNAFMNRVWSELRR